jgi:hypothetical protein
MWRRFMMNRYAGRSGMPYRRRYYGASFGTTLIVVSLAVLVGLYLLGYLAL